MVGSGLSAVAPVFNDIGFAGSLRRGSYNRALLRAARVHLRSNNAQPRVQQRARRHSNAVVYGNRGIVESASY
jgi:hypothetical protein